ncbi:hypothetical protein [Pseudonocardia nigra]|uniref:hypothetical protein n=1 Tax=Pseudonocardia nigra TaxID=1921578 RepID=UPI001C5F83EB|nr:hypothetical protein [Pseudonocardia nigra]
MGSVAEEQVAETVGHRFPGSRMRLEAVVDRMLRDAIGASAPAPDGSAHPLMVFVAAQGGVGIDLDALFSLFHATSADGPMLGEWSMVLDRPLRIGAEYEIRAEVADVVRKDGARTGAFDIATMLIELVGADGRVDARVRTSFVFPRRQR